MLSDIYTIWLREVRKLRADPAHVFITIVRALLIIFIVGSGLNRLVGVPHAGSYTGFFGPGLIAVSAVGLAMQVGVSMIRDRDGTIRNVLVSPISRGALIIGQTLGELTDQIITLGVSLLIVLIALESPVNGLLLAIPIMTLVIIGFASFGIISSLIFSTIKSYSAFITVIFSPLVFLSGAFFPLESFPTWLRVVGLLNPLAYAVDALRAALFGNSTLGLPFDLTVLIPFAALTFVVAWWLLEHREVKT
jgi:ABC-2 type transport system permease protein